MTSERKFIHDLSNPLGIALGLLEAVLDNTRPNGQISAEDYRSLKRALESLNRTTEIVHRRREELVAQEEAAA